MYTNPSHILVENITLTNTLENLNGSFQQDQVDSKFFLTFTAKPDHEKKIRCSHILVKHNKSRRPSSWREENITRSYEEAVQLIQGLQTHIHNLCCRLFETN